MDHRLSYVRLLVDDHRGSFRFRRALVGMRVLRADVDSSCAGSRRRHRCDPSWTRETGGKFALAPRTHGDWDVRAACFHDPGGNVIEINQRLEQARAERSGDRIRVVAKRSGVAENARDHQEETMPLTSRERVLAAIHHEEPDRVPIVLGASNATGMKAPPYRALKRCIGVETEDKYIYDWPEPGTVNPDEQMLIRLHSDVRGVFDREPSSVLERNRNREPHAPFIDSWGSGQREIQPGVWFPGVHPLADTTSIEDLERYPWPDMDDPSRVAHVREQAGRLAAQREYAIMATPWLLFPLERAFAMQGMDTFLLNTISHPEFAVALLRKIADLCMTLMGNLLREIGSDIDIIKIGDDLGTQDSLLISPTMYREMLKPIHADFVAFIKERTDAKVLFHTDGDVFPLIEDFIEIGIDILNPIQTSAGKMSNLKELKRRYGRDLVFCGGIDTHHYLPNGTPEEVRQEVKRVIEILAPGGGYVVSSVQTIMDGVPPENILAMVDAVEEFGHYPIGA